MYSDSEPGCSAQKRHKEEMKYRRALDSKDHEDRVLVFAVVNTYPHPLEITGHTIYNHVANQVGSVYVKIADSIVFWGKMEKKIIAKSK